MCDVASSQCCCVGGPTDCDWVVTEGTTSLSNTRSVLSSPLLLLMLLLCPLSSSSSEILPSSVPQVLINKEPLPHVKGFDVRLLGHCDEIVTELCHQLGEDWLEEIGVEQPVEGVLYELAIAMVICDNDV